jgi:fructokinase
VVLGEVLWDLIDNTRRLGGAPLNFGAHIRRLGHPVTLVSAVGSDELGIQAAERIAALDINTRLLQHTNRFPTGTANVEVGPDGKTHFHIPRPAAYDAVELSAQDVVHLGQPAPGCLYFGTLFSSTPTGGQTLRQILAALPAALKFYDLNLRPGADCPKLVKELLTLADVVKLNEEELRHVHEFTGLPLEVEAFCRQSLARYEWRAVAVTLGDRGCAIYTGGEFVQAKGHAVDVVDTVGAGDAFAAALLHGLSQNWKASRIAEFANRVGALVASRHGAIPDWTLEEAVQP